MPLSRHRGLKVSDDEIGLLALGSSGPWEVAIDETLAGPARWFAQIEGPTVSVYFQITSLDVIDDVLLFLTMDSQGTENGKLSVTNCDGSRVSLVRDDEFTDRYFVEIQAKPALDVRFTIKGADLSDLVKALRDVKNDLLNPD